MAPEPDADDHHPSARGQEGEHGGDTAGAHQLERDVVGTVVGYLIGLDDFVGTEIADVPMTRHRANRRHHEGSGDTGQLHRGDAHAAGGTGDEHPFPGTETGLG